MNDDNQFGPLDTVEILLIEALRMAELWDHTLASVKIAEALDAVIQTKNEMPPH